MSQGHLLIVCKIRAERVDFYIKIWFKILILFQLGVDEINKFDNGKGILQEI